MEFKEIVELMTFENVLEGLGAAAGAAILWSVFFGGGINLLLEILVSVT